MNLGWLFMLGIVAAITYGHGIIFFDQSLLQKLIIIGSLFCFLLLIITHVAMHELGREDPKRPMKMVRSTGINGENKAIKLTHALLLHPIFKSQNILAFT